MTGYYVSIIRDKDYRLLLGPYDTHEESLQYVDHGRKLATDYDSRTVFDAFGTCKVDRPGKDLPAGIFGR